MIYKKGLNLRKMVWRSVYYGKSDFDAFSHFGSGVSVKNSERNMQVGRDNFDYILCVQIFKFVSHVIL